MGNPDLKFWNKKHFEKEELANMSQPSDFVKYAMQYFLNKGSVLELATGTGSDALFLVNQGFKVMATDFSKTALDAIQQKITPSIKHNLTTSFLDLTQPFPFPDNLFEIVYANLVIHYFDREKTQKIFEEIFRVLNKGGILALTVNSINDPEYGTGQKIEDGYFELEPGSRKRYYSINSLKKFTNKFKTVILDDKGTDSRRSYQNLIRFIGEKR